jgi:hypothetical protein
MKPKNIPFKKPVLKQIEELYKFDKKESAFFKSVKSDVIVKKMIYRSFKTVIHNPKKTNNGFDIHTHYYKTPILPSVIDIFKPYGLKRKNSDVIAIVSDTKVQGAIVFKTNYKLLEKKINNLRESDGLFKKLYSKMFNKKSDPSFLDFKALKKYVKSRSILEFKQALKTRKIEKYLETYNTNKKQHEQLNSISNAIILNIYTELGVNIKFIANEGFVFKKNLMCFKEK